MADCSTDTNRNKTAAEEGGGARRAAEKGVCHESSTCCGELANEQRELALLLVKSAGFSSIARWSEDPANR